jgi:hypothetical protein
MKGDKIMELELFIEEFYDINEKRIKINPLKQNFWKRAKIYEKGLNRLTMITGLDLTGGFNCKKTYEELFEEHKKNCYAKIEEGRFGIFEKIGIVLEDYYEASDEFLGVIKPDRAKELKDNINRASFWFMRDFDGKDSTSPYLYYYKNSLNRLIDTSVFFNKLIRVNRI